MFAIPSYRRHPLFDGNDMQASDRHARVIIKPYNHATPLGIQSGVIGTGHRISAATARNDGECLKRAGLQMLTNIANHTQQDCYKCLTSATRNFWRTVLINERFFGLSGKLFNDPDFRFGRINKVIFLALGRR